MLENILYEEFLLDSKRENQLKYLDEYLIESNGISLSEAKELAKLVIQEGKYDFEQLVKKYNDITKKIDHKYYDLKKKAKGSPEKLKKIEAWRKAKMDKAYSTHKKYLKILKKNKVSTIDKLKIAARKAPKGKIGLGAAAVGTAAAGGYYGYKKYKSKK